MNAFNLLLRFILELCALVGIAAGGWVVGGGGAGRVLLAAGVPLLAAIAWATFRIANDPGKAPVEAPGPLRLLLEAAVFGLAVAGVALAGQPLLAALFAAVIILNYAMMPDRLRRLLGRP